MALRCSEGGRADDAVRLLQRHPEERREEGACVLPMDPTPDGGSACMFLESNLCGYRMRHGVETLPVSCAKFPYLGMLTPRRRIYGLSFACPTALDLLAERGHEPLVDGYEGEPPSVTLCDFRGDGPAHDEAAAMFWDTHWSWVEAFSRVAGRPAERLHELGGRITGADPVPVRVDADLWAATTFDPRLGAPLLREGAHPSVLAAVWDDDSARITPDDIRPDPPDGALLNAYLDHRLMAPEFLMTRASLVRVLGALFAAVGRFRVERAQGRRAMHAVMHFDRMLLHSDWIDDLFPAEVDEMVALASLWALAIAE